MDRLWVYKFERKKYMKPSFSQRNVNAEDWGRNKKKCFSLVHTIPYSKGFLKFGETEPPPISDWLLWFSISRRGQKAYCSFPNSYWLRDMGALSKTWNGQHSLNPRKKSVFVWNGSEAPRWAQKDLKWSMAVRLTILDPFGPLWSVEKPAMFGHFWSKMVHFLTIPSHERWTPN